MGSNYSSEQSTGASTARIILQDGHLKELPCPVKVHQVLQSIKDSSQIQISSVFVCDSDDLEFGDCVPAIDDDEDLLPGKLYFVLPESYMRRPIRAEEMASLAVKASTALLKNQEKSKSNINGICCRGRTPEEMVLVEAGPQNKKVVAGHNRERGNDGPYVRRKRPRTRHEYNKGRNLTLNLSVVIEEE